MLDCVIVETFRTGQTIPTGLLFVVLSEKDCHPDPGTAQQAEEIQHPVIIKRGLHKHPHTHTSTLSAVFPFLFQEPQPT